MLAAKAALAEDDRRDATRFVVPESDKAKFRLWKLLGHRLQQGDGLSDEEHSWWKSFRASPLYQVFQQMEETSDEPVQMRIRR